MSFFASLGLKWDEFKSGMVGARAEVDKFAAKVNNKGMFSDFQSRANKLRDVAGGIGASLASGNALGAIVSTETALMKMGPAMGAVAAGAALVSVASMGMYSAMSKSRELNNTATQAGLTVVQLLALEKAFAKAGVSADQVPATMTKFASALGELSDPGSKAAKVLASIGLNADSFKGKSQYEAYKLVATGIDGMTSATDKLIAKRVLFGRGGALISGAQIASAEKALPKSAQLMQDFAPTFTAFQVQIGKLAVSFQPLFAGMASEVIPTLMQTIDRLERLDLTAVGQKLGAALAEAFNTLIDGVSKISKGLERIDPKKGLFLSAAVAAFKGDEATTGGVVEAPKSKEERMRLGREAAIKQGLLPPDETTKSEAPMDAVETAKKAALLKYKTQTDTGIDIAAKPEKFTMPVVESLTKVGGGALAGGGTQLVDLNREQLTVQQRIAELLSDFRSQLNSAPRPLPGLYGNAITAR